MSRIKLLIVSMLGVVALGAIASTAANAEPTVACPGTAGNFPIICLQNLAGEKLALGLPIEDQISILSIKELEPNGTNTPSKLTVGLLEVECQEAANEGTLDGISTGSALILKLFIRFSACTVPSEPAECEVVSMPAGTGVSGVITTLLLGAEQPAGEADGDLVFSPEGTNFSEFRIKSKGTETCTQAQTPAKVEGTILGTLLNPETYQESHLLDFENAGAESLNFLLNKNVATLTLTEVVFLDKPTNWATTWDEFPPFALFLRNEA